MKDKTKGILAGSAFAAVCAAATASGLVTNKLVHLALDKESPIKESEKGRKALTGNDGFDRLLESAAQAGKRLADTPHETVTIKSYDALTLTGHWFPCKDAKRVVIAMHGWRSGWANDFGMIADFLRKNQCSVLYAEQRAQGSSEGAYMGFGMLERHDCLEWIRWVNAQGNDRTPIYLVGISMGATTVLMTAGLDLPDNVRGIIADCGFTSAQAIWEHVAKKNLHIPYGPLRSAAVNGLCRRKLGVTSDHCSTTDAMESCAVPILFIHGSDDRFVPVEMTYENHKACAAPKRLLIVPGACHGASYLKDPESYQNAVLAFWQDFDRAGEI